MELRKIGSALQVTPGGNQVDGLPPATSTDWSSIDAPATTDLLGKRGQFFEDFRFFLAIATTFQSFPV